MGGAVEMVGAGATLRNGFPAEDEVEKGPPDGSPKSWSREKNGWVWGWGGSVPSGWVLVGAGIVWDEPWGEKMSSRGAE